MMKKIICGLLACLMLFSMVACGGDDTPPVDTQAQTEDGSDAQSEGADQSESQSAQEALTNPLGEALKPDEILEVPRVNYAGAEIRILQKSTTVDEMYAEKEIGELINDAVYDRNKFVENYLNVKLVYDSAAADVRNYQEFETKVRGAVDSGYDQIHIISNYTYNAPTLIQEGAFLNINGIAEEENLIDLDKKWWNQSFHDESEINGKLYMLCGDITTTIIDWAEVVFYNNSMIKQYVGEDVDILQMVYDFEWTYEEFLRMAHLVGDGKTNGGEWGYTAPTNSNSLDGMIMGMAADLTIRDLRNNPVMNLNTPRNIEIGNRMRALYNNDASANCSDADMSSYFCDGKSMFYTNILVTAGKQLKSTTLDYGVVPPPLYDENQEEYRIVPQDNVSSLSLLCHVDAMLPAVTRTLEVMGSESYINLRHCIQWKCYKQRYLKTEAKGRMFDYIVDNIYYDFGYTYAKVMNGPYQLIRNYARYMEGSNYIDSLTSKLESEEAVAEEELGRFLEKIFAMPQ